MFSFLANLLTGTTGLIVDNKCAIIWMDEPICPKALIK